MPLQFLGIQEVLDMVRTAADVPDCVPPGPKNNVRFVTRLHFNNRGRAIYADDCGAWNAKASTTSSTTYAIVDSRLVCVSLRGGKYCRRGGRNGIWHSLQPQPRPMAIVRVHRHYATLEADNSYRKRVTWFSNVPVCDKVAVVEYQGVHPGQNRPNGNVRHIDRSFLRKRQYGLRDKAKRRPLLDLCESVVQEQEDSVSSPCDLQQVSICCMYAV